MRIYEASASLYSASPVSEAVILVLPLPTMVTSPVLSLTVATVVLLLVYLMFFPLIVTPSDVRVATGALKVPFISTDSVALGKERFEGFLLLSISVRVIFSI